MTTEETEITFIRCPSCRSLVPSVAARCRMCGHQFQKSDVASAPPAAEGTEKRSRIRQRTISVTRGEGDQLNVSAPVTTEAEEVLSHSSDTSIPFVDHYDSEVDVDVIPEQESPRDESRSKLDVEEQVEAQPQLQPVKSPRPLSPSAPLSFRGEKAESPEAEPPVSRPSHGERLEEDHDFDDEGDDSIEAEENDELDDSASAVAHPGGEEPRRKRRRRRRRKKKGAAATELSPGTEGSSAVPPATQEEGLQTPRPAGIIPGFQVRGNEKPRELQFRESPARQQPEESQAVPGSHYKETHHEVRSQTQVHVSEPANQVVTATSTQPVEVAATAQAPKVEEIRQTEGSMQQVRGMEMETQQSNHTALNHQSSEPAAAAGEGSLVGWLVSYAGDRRGTAIELRSGKFFVGRQRLRGSDLVLADESISTPHCLVNAVAGEGLMIQDLMSERGTAVRKSGSQNFVNCSEPVKLQHGDWLRFGNYEVMVCLIPSQHRNG